MQATINMAQALLEHGHDLWEQDRYEEAIRVLSRVRERKLWEGVRRLRIMPPPDVDAAGGVVLWAALHGLVRPRWRARLTGSTSWVRPCSARCSPAASMIPPNPISPYVPLPPARPNCETGIAPL